MTVRIGYNIDTSSIPFERYTDAMRKSNASAHLIMVDNGDFTLRMGDIETIRKVANAVPNCTLIIRLFHRFQGDWKLYPSPQAFLDMWTWTRMQLGALNSRVVFDCPFNEPNLAGDNAALAKPFVDYCIALVRAASVAGIKLAIGCFSMGTPHESLLNTAYLPLWQAVANHKQGISLHLYAAAIPEIGELVPMDTLLSPEKSRQAITSGKWDIKTKGYYIARAYRIIQIFEAHNLGLPELYVTEGIIDNPFNADSSNIKEAWRQKWGMDEFNRDARGAQTWTRWLLAVFKADGFNFEQIMAFLFRHARRDIFYHPAFKALCIFALNAQWGYGYEGHPNGTNKEAGSNFDRPEFAHFREVDLPAINAESYEDDTPMPSYPAVIFPDLDSPLWQNGTLKLSSGANMRSEPYMQDKYKEGVLPAGEYQAKSFPVLHKSAENPHSWYAYQFIYDGQIRRVWIALSAIESWTLEPIPPDTITLELPRELAQSLFDKLKELLAP